MREARTLKTPSEKTLNRLILALIAFIAVGTVVVAAVYVSDQYAAPDVPFVQRQVGQLEAAVRKNPNVVTTRLQLAGAYTAAKRYSDALGQYNQVLRADPKNESALVGRGQVEELVGDASAAAKDFQAVVDMMKGTEFAPVDTQLQQAYYHLGEIALQQGNPSDAIPSLIESLKIDLGDADALNLLGQAYVKTGAADKAVDQLRAAIQYVPVGWCDPYATLAQAYTDLSNRSEAEWAGAMFDFCQEKIDSARTRLQALTDTTAATDAELGLALLAESQGERSDAARYFREVLAKDPQDFTALNGLSRVTDSAPAASSQPTSTPSSPAAPSVRPGGNS